MHKGSWTPPKVCSDPQCKWHCARVYIKPLMEVLNVFGTGMLIFIPCEYTISVAVPQSVGTIGFAESVIPCEHTGKSIGLCSVPVWHTESSTVFHVVSSGQFQPECAGAQPM